MAMGRFWSQRRRKSSLAIICATVKLPVRRTTSVRVNLPNHSALPEDLRPVAVHHLEELVHVRLGVFQHLLVREDGPGDGRAARVTNLRRPVADDEHDLVPKLLQLSELPQPDDVAQVDVAARGVKAHLEPQGLVLLNSRWNSFRSMISATPRSMTVRSAS